MNKGIRNIIYGLCFLIVGIGYLGDLGMLWNFSIFFPGWWTFALIIPSIINMIEKGFNLGNVIFLLMGIYMFMDINHMIHFEISFQLVGAITCVAFGGWLILKGVKES